jgi:hypothetical protein
MIKLNVFFCKDIFLISEGNSMKPTIKPLWLLHGLFSRFSFQFEKQLYQGALFDTLWHGQPLKG